MPPAQTVLVVTAVEDLTADIVIAELNRLGAQVVRLDPADIGPDLIFSARIGTAGSGWAGRLRTPSRSVEMEQVRSVYYRRPSPWRFDHMAPVARDFAAAEARHGLGGLLYNLPDATYVNHPAAVTRADFKPGQLQTAARLGLPIPETLITNDLAEARAFTTEYAPVIYKTFRGVPPDPGGRAGAIWAQRVDPGALEESVVVTAHLFQAEIPKSGDTRVTVVGDQVFATRITTPGRALDWRSGDWDQLVHTPIPVPQHINTGMQSFLKEYALVFGCFDFALVLGPGAAEEWVFIECNPNGQWGWLPDAEQIAAAFASVLMQR
jgi:ATP-grasp ribosomal peptide maturase